MKVGRLPEPLLTFGFEQQAHDPRDGIELFGPIRDNMLPAEVNIGVAGTAEGIKLLSEWINYVSKPIKAQNESAPNQRNYLGFETLFGVQWPKGPIHQVEIKDEDISQAINISDPHLRAHKTVDLFHNSIRSFVNQQGNNASVWFIVVPDALAKHVRPKYKIEKSRRSDANFGFVAKMTSANRNQLALFAADKDEQDAFDYSADFRDQLKARLLPLRIVSQVVKESTITPEATYGEDKAAYARREHDAEVAWNITTTALYKAGANLWRLANVRPGVCYIGLVFKKVLGVADSRFACCGAQMFLDASDGFVFRGALGPWYSEENSSFHLDKSEAEKLMSKIIAEYQHQTGNTPKEVFIHGRARLSHDEWEGFNKACPSDAKLVAVTIKETGLLKLYRKGSYPVLRGTYLRFSDRKAYLFSKGFTLGLGTYLGKETPNPLEVSVDFGEADIEQILADILGLTKLNFNQSKYADGKPVTLRFADNIGRVMVATQEEQEDILPFRFYI